MHVSDGLEQGNQTGTPGTPMHIFAALSHVPFRMLWLGTLFSTAAQQMNMVAQAWLAYDLTGSATMLGLVAGARSVPMLLFSLVGGLVADRVRKRNLIAASQMGLAVSSLTVALLVHTGLIQVGHLMVAGAFQGTCFAFNMPARQAYIPQLVGRRLLSNAIAIQSMGMNFNRIVAPTIAGVLIAVGPRLPFYTTSLLYLSAAFTIMNLPAGKLVDTRGLSALHDFVGGFRYMWNHKIIRTLLLMAFIPTFLGRPFQQLLPVFQADVFRVGPSQLGAMHTAVGVGALISSLAVASVSSHPRIRLLQMIAGVGFGVSLAAFALSPTYSVGLVFLLVVGIFSQGYMIINQILLMTNAEHDMYGRVSSVRMVTFSLNPLGLLALGVLVDQVGAPPVVAVQGMVLALFIIGVAVAYPVLWRESRVWPTVVNHDV